MTTFHLWALPVAAVQVAGFFDGLRVWHFGFVLITLLWILRRRRPVQFGRLEAVRIESGNLPQDVQMFFDAQDQPLSALGFYPAGDFQTVHGRRPNYARFYACALGDMFIEVDVYRSLGGGLTGNPDFRGVTCVTVFEDGASLQTGDFELADGGASAPPQLIYRGRPDLTLEELIAAHREDAEQCAAEHGSALTYPPEQLAKVSVYYAQYQREYFVNRGIIPAPDGYEQTRAELEAENRAAATEAPGIEPEALDGRRAEPMFCAQPQVGASSADPEEAQTGAGFSA